MQYPARPPALAERATTIASALEIRRQHRVAGEVPDAEAEILLERPAIRLVEQRIEAPSQEARLGASARPPSTRRSRRCPSASIRVPGRLGQAEPSGAAVGAGGAAEPDPARKSDR